MSNGVTKLFLQKEGSALVTGGVFQNSLHRPAQPSTGTVHVYKLYAPLAMGYAPGFESETLVEERH